MVRYEKTLEEVTALLERERNDHVICKASLAEAERYSAEVEQAFKELHSRYNVQKVGGVAAAEVCLFPVLKQTLQDYVKKTEATAKDVELQLQQSEKRRCGAEEELKLIAGDCTYCANMNMSHA